jgi:hypothetical protein
MKKIYVITLALMVLFSMTLSASALQYKQKTLENGYEVDATWSDSSTNTYLSVYNSQGQESIYFDVCTLDSQGNIVSCEHGYPIGNVVLDINKQLKTATLSPVQVNMYDYYTGSYDRTVTLQAQWTGIGDTIKGSYTSTSKLGDYTAKFSSDTVYRIATAKGTISGYDLGTSQFATMSLFKSVVITTVK